MHPSRGMVKNGHYLKCNGQFWPKLWNEKLDTNADSENWSKVVQRLPKIISFHNRKDFQDSKNPIFDSRPLEFISKRSKFDLLSPWAIQPKYDDIFRNVSLGRKFIRKWFLMFSVFDESCWMTFGLSSVEIRSYTTAYVIIWTTFRIDIQRCTMI